MDHILEIKKLDERIEYLKTELALESEIMKEFRKLDDLRIEKNKIRAKLYEKLNRKEEYIKKLKQINIASIIKFITGKRKEILREEQMEYDKIKNKFDKILEELNYIQNQKDIINKKLQKFEGMNKELIQVLETKEQTIRKMNPAICDKLDRINEEIDNLEEDILKIHKTIGLGQEAIKDIEYTEKTLCDTDKELNRDLIFSSKGMDRTYKKYKKMERAKEDIDSTNEVIERFKVAVNNHNFCSEILIDSDSFTEFRAFALGGVFATFKVKDSITESKYDLAETRGRIEDMVKLLFKDRENKYTEIERLKEEKDNIIYKN
ncbi:hypothetical protein [Oceanirhabdus sp. W0125-5]|uniref:hypothetical protein n=1 Tax=Oceanirhabdus sp. W0125-5 TaxID=2999116 RepID=UPI0022F2C556|nr:hypothetical protein [Oceanirhabdus sp. W0125-5]WBW96921.1 hypothetical protein OW730_25005 [Oceanirhabdus sp. W0125-5]